MITHYANVQIGLYLSTAYPGNWIEYIILLGKGKSKLLYKLDYSYWWDNDKVVIVSSLGMTWIKGTNKRKEGGIERM